MNSATLANIGAVVNADIRIRLSFIRDKKVFCELKQSACRGCNSVVRVIIVVSE